MAVLADLQEILATSVADAGLPGAAIAVLHDGEVYEAAAGVLNLETGVETTTDSLFQIGSITKVYTSTLIMQLVDAGLVDLDATVRTYVPDGSPAMKVQFLEPDAEGRPQLFFAGRLARRAS